jgi:hypothetical protein
MRLGLVGAHPRRSSGAGRPSSPAS